jgi:hypothetical protein
MKNAEGNSQLPSLCGSIEPKIGKFDWFPAYVVRKSNEATIWLDQAVIDLWSGSKAKSLFREKALGD